MEVNKEVGEAYELVKKEKKNPYVIFKIQAQKEVVVEHIGDEGKNMSLHKVL